MQYKEIENSLDDVINCIVDSKEYKICLEIKSQMDKNEEINNLIEKIKLLQKKYVKSNDKSILTELQLCEKRLNEIPIYMTYRNNLEKVNEMINLVKDELNDYFYQKLNKE